MRGRASEVSSPPFVGAVGCHPTRTSSGPDLSYARRSVNFPHRTYTSRVRCCVLYFEGQGLCAAICCSTCLKLLPSSPGLVPPPPRPPHVAAAPHHCNELVVVYEPSPGRQD